MEQKLQEMALHLHDLDQISAIAFPTTFTAAGGGGGVSQGGTPLTAGQGGSGGGGSTNPGTPQPGRDATGTPGHPGSADAVSPDSGWGNPGEMEEDQIIHTRRWRRWSKNGWRSWTWICSRW